MPGRLVAMGVQVFRVVVRGQFADLTDDQRTALLAEADAHSFHTVAYTEWGTFIYEPNLVAFNFRYEVRLATDEVYADAEAEAEAEAAEPTAPTDPPVDPVDVGLAKAQASLAEWGLGHKYLKATATDMSQVWSG